MFFRNVHNRKQYFFLNVVIINDIPEVETVVRGQEPLGTDDACRAA
jgi:hypothetical protein